jgi:hypothetical protein
MNSSPLSGLWRGILEREGQQHNATYYRRLAREIWQLALHSRQPEIRVELIEISERFRRMADHLERWQGMEQRVKFITQPHSGRRSGRPARRG